MKVNSNNQIGFGNKYRLLVPKNLTDTYENWNRVSNDIASALLENNVTSNTEGSKIQIFFDKFEKEGFDALVIFTKSHVRKLRSAFKKVGNGGDERRKLIDRFSDDVSEKDTFTIMDDIDLGRFIKEKLYPDLKIKKDAVLVSSQNDVKGYYVNG